MKSNRIVIPTELQNKAVDITHEGHLGIVRTKALMREKVGFPIMNKLVETKVKSCLACQIATSVMSREPLKMATLPYQPCEEMSVEFVHVDGEILLVIDDYSRFSFVESEASSAVIPKLYKLFATFGTPNVLKSDNGPPFNGQDFAKFADVLGFKHRKNVFMYVCTHHVGLQGWGQVQLIKYSSTSRTDTPSTMHKPHCNNVYV